MKRPVVICIDPNRDDLDLLDKSLSDSGFEPLCFSSLWLGITRIGTMSPRFVIIDYSAGNHQAILETVRLCKRQEVPFAVMVARHEIPTPEEVEEIGCMWLKEYDFLSRLPKLIGLPGEKK